MITASTAGEKVVRFGSPAAGLAQIRVEILSARGDSLFDSAWKDGNVLDWQADQLGTGSYRCVVMVKDLDGQVTQREAVLTVDGDHVSIEGGIENGPKITMLAHDEKNGAIVNTSGDLTFRFGEFFASKEKERMRLTAEGNLGIGTDRPQAPLDVNGLIRTSKGIMFPDGTILTTAGKESVATEQSGAVTREVPLVVGGLTPGSQTSTNARRLIPRPNAPGYQFVVDSSGVHIGTTNAFGLDVAGNVTLSSNLALPASSATAGVISLGGNRFIHTFGSNNTFVGSSAGNLTMSGGANTALGKFALAGNTSGVDNVAIGLSALGVNISGGDNTAVGTTALASNTLGSGNTAVGSGALLNNTDGISNTAIGESALLLNSSGNLNTAIGKIALQANTMGVNNTANGYGALAANTSGSNNVAIGRNALGQNINGNFNIGIGFSAGTALVAGSTNIHIGTGGVSDESATIRIGSGQTKFFVAGVRGVTTGLMDGAAVMIDSAGQLGTVSSSATVKRDIEGIGAESSALMKLRPVSFFYRGDTVGIRQFGLIAEEVAEVMPELVQFSPDGQAETVRYHFLPPLLLDQVQKQERKIEEQQKTIDALMQRLEALERQSVRSQ